VVAAVCLFIKVLMFESVGSGGVVLLLTNVELVELMRCVGRRTEERLEELFRVFIVRREDRVGRKWGEGDLDDSQVERWGF